MYNITLARPWNFAKIGLSKTICIQCPYNHSLLAADNVIIYFKRSINLFIHGLNQEIGLLANYFPVEPIVYPLQINQIHKIDFQAQKTHIDESLGCNTKVNEEDYYGCAKDVIARNLQINPKPGCTVPMFSNLFRQRYVHM